MVDWFNRFGGVILSRSIGFLTGFTLALRAIRRTQQVGGVPGRAESLDRTWWWQHCLVDRAVPRRPPPWQRGLACPPVGSRNLDAFMLVGSGQAGTAWTREALKAGTEEAMRFAGGSQGHYPEQKRLIHSYLITLQPIWAAADQAGRFTNVWLPAPRQVPPISQARQRLSGMQVPQRLLPMFPLNRRSHWLKRLPIGV